MKIIDILNKKANGTLTDEFKFCFRDIMYAYHKSTDEITKKDGGRLGGNYTIENYLNEEVLLLKTEDQEEKEDIKKIEELNYYTISSLIKGKTKENIDEEFRKQSDKINELVKTVNKLTEKL